MDDSVKHMQSVYSGIVELIGFFDLDPDRVVECLLNVYIFRPECELFRELVKAFSRKSVTNFIGKKFELFAGLSEKANYSTMFKNAISVTAHLIKHDVILIEDIWLYMHPSDQEFAEKTEEALRGTASFYQDAFNISLTLSDEESRKKKEEEER